MRIGAGQAPEPIVPADFPRETRFARVVKAYVCPVPPPKNDQPPQGTRDKGGTASARSDSLHSHATLLTSSFLLFFLPSLGGAVIMTFYSVLQLGQGPIHRLHVSHRQTKKHTKPNTCLLTRQIDQICTSTGISLLALFLGPRA